jgi:hypothetical protein
MQKINEAKLTLSFQLRQFGIKKARIRLMVQLKQTGLCLIY